MSQSFRCLACKKENAPLRCAGCKSVSYCSKECQAESWKAHKGACKLARLAGTAELGVSKKVKVAGAEGQTPKAGQKVFVAYRGTLVDGTVFDSNEAFSFHLGLGEVITGWDTAVGGMTKGEKATFGISSEHAYGSSGAGAAIPPNATLIFEITLNDFCDAELQRTGTNYL